MEQVSEAKFTGNLKESILKALEPLGGFGAFVKSGDRVFLKANFNTADPYPASSDLAFLRAVIELVFVSQAAKVSLGDSSTMSANTGKVMEKIGVSELLK